MAKMKDYLDSEEARANREANLSEESTDADTIVPGGPAEEPVEEPEPAQDPGKARLGPLGAFFKRRADFFEQEATMLAIQLERMWQDAARPKE